MRSFLLFLTALLVTVSSQQGFNRPFNQGGNRRVTQGGGNRRPGNNRNPNRPNTVTEKTLKLGLLANNLGVNPVPGGTIGSPVGGAFQVVPGGALGLSRDESCWCQPINQVCTALRPNNLDLVTRIINRPGSPGTPGQAVTGCNPDQRFCCNTLSGRPITGVTEPPQTSGSLTQFGKCGARNSLTSTAISPTADFGEYPWMAVVMGPGYSYIAGGVLISANWVLSAAHKIKTSNGLVVRLGDYDVGDPNDVKHFESGVSQVIIHPGFNSQNLANDIALLRLSQPVPFHLYSHISPACLPSQNQLFEGQRCYVSGWGKNAFEHGNHQRKLQEVDVPIINSFRCQNQLRNTRLGQGFNLDQTSFICAGGELNKDACGGDGGSPLVCPVQGGWTVAGLVAWGVGCGRLNVPAAYVNVAAYSNFIRQYVG